MGKSEEIEFYDVKKRERVKINLSSVSKVQYDRKLKNGGNQTRFAFRGKTDDGRILTKFCSQEAYSSADVPIEST